MKIKIIKKLHQIIMEIAKVDEDGLNKIAVELLEIEKKLMVHQSNRKDIDINTCKKFN